jgi:hypothetical protein
MRRARDAEREAPMMIVAYFSASPVWVMRSALETSNEWPQRSKLRSRQMLNAHIVSLFVASFMQAHSPHPAILVSCDANSNVASECKDEFTNAARKMFGQQYEGDRAGTAGEAVRNCMQCATKTLSDRVHNFGSSNSARK